MPTFTVTQQKTTPIAGATGAALSRDAAINAAIAAAPGPAGKQVRIWSCEQIAASGPTGTYATNYNTTEPQTGATFSATDRDDAIKQAVAAGPTGPGAGVTIRQTYPF